jgi:hypothetical protein
MFSCYHAFSQLNHDVEIPFVVEMLSGTYGMGFSMLCKIFRMNWKIKSKKSFKRHTSIIRNKSLKYLEFSYITTRLKQNDTKICRKKNLIAFKILTGWVSNSSSLNTTRPGNCFRSAIVLALSLDLSYIVVFLYPPKIDFRDSRFFKFKFKWNLQCIILTKLYYYSNFSWLFIFSKISMEFKFKNWKILRLQFA